MARSPLSIPGAVRWGRAEDAVGAVDGQRVTSIRDRVADSVYELMLASGYGPNYRASDPKLGGKPSLVFDGSRESTLRETLNLVVPSTGFSVWVVLARSGGGSNAFAYGADDTSVTANGTRIFQVGWNNSNQPRFVSFGDNASSRVAGGPIASGFPPLVILGIANDNAGSAYSNGTLGSTTTAGSVGGGSLVPPRRTSLGNAFQSNSNYPYIGTIAEWGVYDHPLTSAERSTLHSYVQDRYGITVAGYVPDTEVPEVLTRQGTIKVDLGTRGRLVVVRTRKATVKVNTSTRSRFSLARARVALVDLSVKPQTRTRLVRVANALAKINLSARAAQVEVDVAVAKPKINFSISGYFEQIQTRSARVKVNVLPKSRHHKIIPLSGTVKVGLRTKSRLRIVQDREARVLLRAGTVAYSRSVEGRFARLLVAVNSTTSWTEGQGRRDITLSVTPLETWQLASSALSSRTLSSGKLEHE